MKKAESAKEAIHLLTCEYENLNIEGVLYYLTEDIFWIGTASHEHRFGKDDVRALLEDDFLNDPTPYVVAFMDLKETVVRSGVSSLFAWMTFAKQDNSNLTVETRSSYVCCQTEDGYKICSWHCSIGTALQNQSEYFPIAFANDIMQRATEDALTGLMNRGSFEELVERHLEIYSNPFAFILIDLDNFKYANDNYGHQCGDEVLRFAAEQMRCSFDSMDSIARLGGDEFVVLIPAAEDENQVVNKVNTFIHNLSQTIYLNGHPHVPSASVGIYLCKEGHRTDYKHCYKSADAAMYKAKNSGKGTWRVER